MFVGQFPSLLDISFFKIVTFRRFVSTSLTNYTHPVIGYGNTGGSASVIKNKVRHSNWLVPNFHRGNHLVLLTNVGITNPILHQMLSPLETQELWQFFQ
jgi:hypothetical protein